MTKDLLISHLGPMSEGEIIQFLQRHRLFSGHLIPLNSHILKSVVWRETLREQVSHSLHLASVFTGLMIKLKEKKIAIIPLKGPVLADTLYGDVGKRYFGDLDLLVRRDELKVVVQTLEQEGFEQVHPRKDLSPRQIEHYFRWKKDFSLLNRSKRIAVELHAGVYYHQLLDKKRAIILFQDLEEMQFAGISVRCMNRENTFLYLTYHGAQHQYFRLFWLRDVAEALRRWRLDHSKILQNAQVLGIERLLALGLELARDLFESETPANYDELLKNSKRIVVKLKRLCMKRILGPEKPTFIGKIQHHYFLMMLKPGLKYKWNVVTSIFHRWYIRKFLGGH